MTLRDLLAGRGSALGAGGCDRVSANVLFVELEDAKPIVLSQALLKAALRVAIGRDDPNLDLLCYNVCEQQGVDPDADLETSPQEDHALLINDELNIFHKFEPTLDDLNKLLLVLQAAYGAHEMVALTAGINNGGLRTKPSVHSGSDRLGGHHLAAHHAHHVHHVHSPRTNDKARSGGHETKDAGPAPTPEAVTAVAPAPIVVAPASPEAIVAAADRILNPGQP